MVTTHHGKICLFTMSIIPIDVLRKIEGTTLFYPHSGSDLLVPIQIFSPFVTDFWFADIAYFRSDQQCGREFAKCLSGDATKTLPLLSGDQSYEFQGSEISGPPLAQIEYRVDPDYPDRTYPFLAPCVRTETYLHRNSGKTIRIHLRRGYSVSAFRKEITTLGVFFYRGDSSEGSNTPWLLAIRRRLGQPGTDRHYYLLGEVLDKLIDGGLVVTDGSRCENRSNPYKPLRQFLMCHQMPGRDAIEQTQPFTGPEGHIFICVGYAGSRHGPTLIWQVHRPQSAPTNMAEVQPK